MGNKDNLGLKPSKAQLGLATWPPPRFIGDAGHNSAS